MNINASSSVQSRTRLRAQDATRLAAEVAWPAAQRGAEVDALTRDVAALERQLGAAASQIRT